jgi:hypothetical protein
MDSLLATLAPGASAGVTHGFSLAQKISREKFSTDGSATKISGPNLTGLHG